MFSGLRMKTKFLWVAAALAVFVAMAPVSPARAITLDSWINSSPNGSYTPSFIASASSTTISFAGYDITDFTDVTHIGLFLNGTGPNLLGNSWVFSAAASGSDALIYSDGTSVPALSFGGVTIGSYDKYSETIATTIGNSYTLDFTYAGGGSPNGFIVTTSATPLPSTWIMLITGFVGFTFLAFRKKNVAVLATA